MEIKTVGIFFTIFIGVLIATAFFGSIADTSNTMTSLQTTTNETISLVAVRVPVTGAIAEGVNITVINYPNDWKKNGACPINVLYFINGSNSVLTEGIHFDYNASSGKLNFTNTIAVNGTDGGNSNTTKLTYTYCANGYVGNKAAGSIVPLILIMAAIGLIVFIVFYLKGSLGY